MERNQELATEPVESLVSHVHGSWQPIEAAPKNRKLIVGYFNPLKNWRTVVACYFTDGNLESDTDESGFAPEGWYEATEAYEYLMPCDQEPTHWMPLPEPPKE